MSLSAKCTTVYWDGAVGGFRRDGIRQALINYDVSQFDTFAYFYAISNFYSHQYYSSLSLWKYLHDVQFTPKKEWSPNQRIMGRLVVPVKCPYIFL